jgi:hypothetical protein
MKRAKFTKDFGSPKVCTSAPNLDTHGKTARQNCAGTRIYRRPVNLNWALCAIEHGMRLAMPHAVNASVSPDAHIHL